MHKIMQDLIPTLASKFVLPIIIAAKVGIKSCICACMDATSEPVGIVFA